MSKHTGREQNDERTGSRYYMSLETLAHFEQTDRVKLPAVAVQMKSESAILA